MPDLICGPPGPRVHRVIAELDARGEIDGHATMCLRQAIGATHAGSIELVLVDLRDLTAIGPAELELLRGQNADCHAHGVALGLLISGRESQARLAEALVRAGLGETLHYSTQSSEPPDRNRRRVRARAPRAPHLVRAGARFWPRRARARPT